MYLLGSSDKLTLHVTVLNKNEDAFEAMFYISLPIGEFLFRTKSTKDGVHLGLS